MPTHDTETLAEVLAAHEFTSTSGSRGGINTHHAGCACGIGFDWYERDAQHRDHLFAVVAAQAKAEAWDEGYEAGYADELRRVYPDMGKRINPYRAASSVPQATEPTHTNKEES